jgi:hypothetical protein
MTEPWIGDENTDRPGICTFAPRPGDEGCGAPATRHIMSESAIYGLVALPTCDVHAQLARTAGPWIGEHEYTSNCSGRWSRWRLDGCVRNSL